MAPFPEAEIMTIKRLEVALRKMDFKLLKDGAYKLHEKYHGGHRFEYLDLLKDIYIEITNNPSIPDDVKDILSPTIEDILTQGGVQADISMSPSESLNNSEEAVASANNFQEEYKEETKINAFDAFSPQKVQAPQTNPPRYFTQSPFSAEPFRDFNIPKDEPQAIAYKEQSNKQNEDQKYEIQEEHYQEIVNETIKEFSNLQENKEIQQEESQKEIHISQEKKSIGILYFQDNSQEKTKNILKLKEIISASREKESLIDDLFALISEISTQTDTSVVELQGILENIAKNGNSTNLITNSQSAMFSDLLDSINATHSLIKNEDNSKINFIPLFGLSNLFTCEECKEKHFNKIKIPKPLVLECPKCKNPMYPELYANIDNGAINLEYYNEALVNLANSKTWLVIHSSFCDKTSLELIKSTLKVSKVEEIYILDKDFNSRETYKNLISSIKEEVKLYTQGNILEDFFNNI
ncbi:MAG: hypothetical protein IKU37_02950 [Candidatus Gastranaerophilales bacterium]|nr:hypothetical protein [Candidatus Gastranaerophilales bacterium]